MSHVQVPMASYTFAFQSYTYACQFPLNRAFELVRLEAEGQEVLLTRRVPMKKLTALKNHRYLLGGTRQQALVGADFVCVVQSSGALAK